MDLYIPNKISKIIGQQFGFVRFGNIMEAVKAAKRNERWIWGHKLVGNLARFQNQKQQIKQVGKEDPEKCNSQTAAAKSTELLVENLGLCMRWGWKTGEIKSAGRGPDWLGWGWEIEEIKVRNMHEVGMFVNGVDKNLYMSENDDVINLATNIFKVCFWVLMRTLSRAKERAYMECILHNPRPIN